MVFLTALSSSGKKNKSSSSCSKSSRTEINCVRKMPLKHPSQTSTDHSRIYISLVYFLPPQKWSTTSALFHLSTAPTTRQTWRTAVEEESAFMISSGDGAQCWDMHGRTPSLLRCSQERTARQEITAGQRGIIHTHYLHKLLPHSFSSHRKKHKVAAGKVRLQYRDLEVEIRKQTCEVVQILSITVPLSVCTRFKPIKQVGKKMYVSKILLLSTALII